MYQHGFISLLYICTSNYDMIVSIHLLLKVTIILKILALARVYIKPNMFMLAHFPQPMLYLNYVITTQKHYSIIRSLVKHGTERNGTEWKK